MPRTGLSGKTPGHLTTTRWISYAGRANHVSSIIVTIAEDLYTARQTLTPIDHIRHRLPDGDLDAAYAIAEYSINRRIEQQGLKRVGRKVGLTNPMVQKKA